MQAAQVRGYEVGEVLYMAMELSNRRWKLGFSNGAKVRRKSIEARDRQRFLEEVALAKSGRHLPHRRGILVLITRAEMWKAL